MIQQATEKLKNEMAKENNPYVQAVGQFLLQHIESNPANAEKILAEEKNILKSLDEMRKAAEKKKVGNVAVLTDQEGFAIVLNYFGIKANTESVTNFKPVIPVPNLKPSVDFDVNLDDLLGE